MTTHSSEGRPKTYLALGIMWVVLAAIFNAVTSAVVKHSLEFVRVEMTVMARSVVGFVVMSIFILLAPHQKRLAERFRPQEIRMQLIRSVFAVGAIYLTYFALESLDLADTLILTNTLPIFIPFVLFFWKGIPIQHRLWWGIGLSFLGVLLVIRPGIGVFQLASFLALSAAIVGAVSTVALRYAHFKEGSAITLFYYFLITIVIAGIVTLFAFKENWTSLTSEALFWLLGIGVGGLGWQVCFTLAAKNAPIRVTAPLLYVSVILGALINWWVCTRLISFWEIGGCVCILLGACLVVYLYPKEQR